MVGPSSSYLGLNLGKSKNAVLLRFIGSTEEKTQETLNERDRDRRE